MKNITPQIGYPSHLLDLDEWEGSVDCDWLFGYEFTYWVADYDAQHAHYAVMEQIKEDSIS